MCYDLYSKTLKSHGFVVNIYDRCIANRTLKDKEFTIAWYVYNNPSYHPKNNTGFLTDLVVPSLPIWSKKS